ncbi:MAG: hypothetical protein U0840_06090 [Gemmataceae bacterium]
MAADLIAILFALHREARPFLANRRSWRSVGTGMWQGPGSIVVMVTGMGSEATRQALSFLEDRAGKPDRVISAGFAGSLDESLRIGALVQADVVVAGTDKWKLPTTPVQLGNAVRLVTTSVPVLGRAERDQLRETMHAQVVDMETATIASWCEERTIPLTSLRVISDDYQSPLPEEIPQFARGESIRVGRLLVCVFKRPGLIRDLVRLGRDSKRCAIRLSDGLHQLLEQFHSGCRGE